jgi:MFS family permease
LLIAGSISDHLGRKPVIFAALVLEIVAMALFTVASGPDWLIAARIVQGLATGIAGASIGAALVDVDRAKGQLVNSIAPLSGMAVGALGTSALIQYGPFPLHLVYALLLAAFAIQAGAIWLTAETADSRPGVIRSLKPMIAIPQQVKRPLALATPINIANWTLGGFYLSLVPSLVVSTTGSKAPLVGGAVVTALMVSGAIAVYLRRARSGEANLTFGVSAMTLGILTVVAGVHLAHVPLLLLGTIFTGAGFGTNFLGAIGTIMPLAKPDERAGLLSAFYIQSYLAFSLPAIVAGFLAKSLGYALTTDIYATAIILTTSAGLMVLRAGRAKAAA